MVAVNESNLTDGTLRIYERPTKSTMSQLVQLEAERPDIAAVKFKVVSADDVAEFPQLKRLRVKLDDLTPSIAGAVLDKLGPYLVGLRLTNQYGPQGALHIGEEHLAPLARFDGLRSIDLGGCRQVTDENLNHLTPHRGLELARLTDMDLNGSGLSHLSAGLQELFIGLTREEGGEVTREQMEVFARFESLQRLNLRGQSFAKDALLPLARLASLKDLQLRGDVPDEALAFLADMSNLEGLTLGKDKINAAPGLTGLKSLVFLELGKTKIPDKVFALLGKLPGLRWVRSVGGMVSDKGVSAFKGHGALEVLSLSGSKLTDGVVETLESLPKLRALHLHKSKLTLKGLERIAALCLTEFAMSGGKLGDEMVPALEAMKARGVCQRIQVAKCGLSKAGLKQLKSSLGESFAALDNDNPASFMHFNRPHGWVMKKL